MTSDFTKRVAATLGRHLVTLSCQQYVADKDQPNTLVFSGFVIDLHGEWFYVTAGHIIEDIRSATKAGAIFDAWRLGDYAAGNSFNGAAVPYDFEIEKWLAFDDRRTGLDYAIVHIHGLIRLQLEAGNVQAIGKAAWSDHVAKADHWALVGVPSESISYDGGTIIGARVVLVPLVPTEAPSVAGEKSNNQFYAKPSEPSDPYFSDPDGFSGGPVFSLTKLGEDWRYNVIGVQSSWYSESGALAICPFATFAQEIEEVVAEALALHKEQASDSSAA